MTVHSRARSAVSPFSPAHFLVEPWLFCANGSCQARSGCSHRADPVTTIVYHAKCLWSLAKSAVPRLSDGVLATSNEVASFAHCFTAALFQDRTSDPIIAPVREMRGTLGVPRVITEDRSSVIVTCVHGTWARGSRWPGLEMALGETLRDCPEVTVNYFEWSGRNSVAARRQAAADLRRSLVAQIAAQPDARHVLVAHSHGANVVLHALKGAPEPRRHEGPASTSALRATADRKAGRYGGPPKGGHRDEGGHHDRTPNPNREARTEKGEPQVSAIVLLSPPLLDCQLVDEPEGAANKLLLAAVAMVPILLAASTYARWAFGVSELVQLLGVLIVVAAWLMLFRPAAVRRRAEVIAEQVTLPRLEFPGLVVRTPRDEATFALSAASTFARIARRIWSHVLATRAPFVTRDHQRRSDARGVMGLGVSNRHNVHVSFGNGWWRVTRTGRVGSRHHTQRRAIAAGIKLARRTRGELVTHGRDGRIRSKDSYGPEGAGPDREH